jgi:protein-S-isoprenylcysteine O-methyltransferase Ste14
VPELALVLGLVSAVLTFGVRILVQLRRTGSTGVVGMSANAGWAERIGGGLFIAGIVTLLAAPLLQLVDVVEPIEALDGGVGYAVGTIVALAGIVATFYAQIAMGSSWRIGVDESEHTALVTGGPFAIVRNPIYSAMLPTVAGILLLVPNPVALIGYAALLTGLEIQTRLVEEPYLLAEHGEAYRSYAARVGRFVPGVGRL